MEDDILYLRSCGACYKIDGYILESIKVKVNSTESGVYTLNDVYLFKVDGGCLKTKLYNRIIEIKAKHLLAGKQCIGFLAAGIKQGDLRPFELLQNARKYLYYARILHQVEVKLKNDFILRG